MRRIALVAATLAAIAPTGCSTVQHIQFPRSETIATNAGNVTYSLGKAVQVFKQPEDKVEDAVLKAMADFKVTSIRKLYDDRGRSIEGKTGDGRTTTVLIQALGDASKVSTHVGLPFVGDEAFSLALMDSIGEHLGVKTAEAVTDKIQTIEKRHKWFSREAVPDDVMFHDKAVESNYHDTPGGLP